MIMKFIRFRSMSAEGIQSFYGALGDRLGFRNVASTNLASLMYLPEDVVLPATPSGDGLAVRRLLPSDAEYINDRWPHRGPQSTPMMKYQIETWMSFGVVDNGTLVGWVMETEYGGFGVLHCEESHRRRGIGRSLLIFSPFFDFFS